MLATQVVAVFIAGATALPHRHLSADDALEARLASMERKTEAKMEAIQDKMEALRLENEQQQMLIEKQQELIHTLREESTGASVSTSRRPSRSLCTDSSVRVLRCAGGRLGARHQTHSPQRIQTSRQHIQTAHQEGNVCAWRRLVHQRRGLRAPEVRDGGGVCLMRLMRLGPSGGRVQGF